MPPTTAHVSAPHQPARGQRLGSLFVLAGMGACLLIGLAIQPAGAGGATSLQLLGVTLPAVCMFHLSTGVPCAGCGLTRSIVLLLHGRAADSIAIHPFGIIIVALALLMVPPRLARVAGSGRAWIARWDRAWGIGVLATVVLMLAWWISRVGFSIWLRALV